MTDFIETVLNTAQAVQAYALGVHRARALSKSLMWQDITKGHEKCDDIFFKIIRDSEDEVEYQGWADVLYNEADPVTVAIEMAGDRRREELVGYRVRKLCRAIGLGRRTDEEPALLEFPVGWTADLNGHLFRFLAHGNLVAHRFSEGNCIRRRRERDALGFEHDDEEVIGLIGHGRCDCGNCQTDGDEG